MYHGVEIMVEPGIVVHGQRIACPLYHLVGIGVVEREVAAVLALHETGRNGEIVKPTVLLAFAEGGGNGHRAVDLYAWAPKDVVQMDGRKGYLDNGGRGAGHTLMGMT